MKTSLIDTVQISDTVQVRISLTTVEDADPGTEGTLRAVIYIRASDGEWRSTGKSAAIGIRRGHDLDPEEELKRTRAELDEMIARELARIFGGSKNQG